MESGWVTRGHVWRRGSRRGEGFEPRGDSFRPYGAEISLFGPVPRVPPWAILCFSLWEKVRRRGSGPEGRRLWGSDFQGHECPCSLRGGRRRRMGCGGRGLMAVGGAVRGGLGPAPNSLYSFFGVFGHATLKRGANFHCAYGAGFRVLCDVGPSWALTQGTARMELQGLRLV